MGKLRFQVEDIQDIDEPLRGFYQEVDGNYVLNTEEKLVPASKLIEFRDNNITLKQQLETFQNKYKDVDLDEIEKLRKLKQDVEDSKLVEFGKIDELVSQKTQRMRMDLENQVNNLKGQLEAEQKKSNESLQSMQQTVIELEATKPITNVGVPKDGVMQFFNHLARSEWKFVDGRMVAMNGDRIMYGTDGITPMTWEEWAIEKRKTYGNMFEPSQGTGSRGGGQVGFNATALKDLTPSERMKLHHEGKLNR